LIKQGAWGAAIAFGDQGVFLKKYPLEPQKLLGKLLAKFLTVLFYPS
jgi:hypothetical protein